MTRARPVRSRLPDEGTTVGIVTTYHPEPGLSDRLRAVIGAVRRVVVVDNGSTPTERQEIQVLAAAGTVDVIWNDENRGLAGALNQGLQVAVSLGARWGLLLDQDSTAKPEIVAEAARVVSQLPTESIATVGAGIVGRDSGAKGRYEKVPAVITSGTLLSVDAWRTLGGFREDFFVDYVDLEFCLRARANGYAILRSKVPTLHHSIGDSEQRRVLWRTVTVTNHTSERRYSITRNRLILWRIYARREPAFVLRDITAFVKETAKILMLEDDRRAKLRSTLVGTIDGLRAKRRPQAG